MEPYSIHCTCSAIIEDLSELKSVYPHVRVKYTLQRKTYGSGFAIKIQTRKKCERRHYHYLWDTVQVHFLRIKNKSQTHSFKKTIDYIIDQCYSLYMCTE